MFNLSIFSWVYSDSCLKSTQNSSPDIVLCGAKFMSTMLRKWTWQHQLLQYRHWMYINDCIIQGTAITSFHWHSQVLFHFRSPKGHYVVPLLTNQVRVYNDYNNDNNNNNNDDYDDDKSIFFRRLPLLCVVFRRSSLKLKTKLQSLL